jgi:hypothetical protein
MHRLFVPEPFEKATQFPLARLIRASQGKGTDSAVFAAAFMRQESRDLTDGLTSHRNP